MNGSLHSLSVSLHSLDESLEPPNLSFTHNELALESDKSKTPRDADISTENFSKDFKRQILGFYFLHEYPLTWGIGLKYSVGGQYAEIQDFPNNTGIWNDNR